MHYGILFALLALVAWGFDDLFIEKSTRKLGDAITLFCVATFGSIFLLPFVWTEITTRNFWTLGYPLLILLLATIVTTIAALADYEALRTGKLSIVEPIYALEVPITLVISLLIIHENLTNLQLTLTLLLTAGIFLVASKTLKQFKNLTWERGVRMALLSASFMGITNFFTGLSGRLASPMAANWFIYSGLALVMLVYLVVSKRMAEVTKALSQHSKIIFAVSSADLIAWVSFTYSASYIPIALATAISEAYIALAALLGLFINKEKLKNHQLLGLVITVATAITLSIIS